MSDTPTDDLVDYDRIWHYWPAGTQYGQPGTWFAYVGRTRQMRNALVARRLSRGPRGKVRTAAGSVRCRSTLSGEFEAR